MLLYRISKTTRAGDLSGEGARLAGGRWNLKGTSVIYTSESVALATLETLVHLPLTLVLSDFALTVLDFPDDLFTETIALEALPSGWNRYPPPRELAEKGSAWVASLSSPALKVPSAVTPDGEAWNIILNPAHPDFKRIRLVRIAQYLFDQRLFRR